MRERDTMRLRPKRQPPVAMLLAMPLVAVAAGWAVPLAAQETGVPPIAIETLEIEPTVVKTGDLIMQTYRVRFPDLIDEGRELLILEDRMAPENLSVHPFEAVSLEVEKRQVEDEPVWDFAYGLRLIAPEKAVYVIPSFGFYYLIRDLGEDIEDAEIQQVDGGQRMIRYVTTMNDLPVLDIRDTIELGDFGGQAALFRTMAWTLAPLPLAIWLFLLFRQARRTETVPTEVARELEEIERLESLIPAPLSIWEARRALRKQVQALQEVPTSDNGSLRALTRDLVIATREYLQAELPDLRSGDTAKDIQRYVEALKDGGRKEALASLSSRLVVYQAGLERDDSATIADPMEEAEAIDASLTELRPHIQMWRSVTGLFGGRG